jgi:hypothetical protein
LSTVKAAVRAGVGLIGRIVPAIEMLWERAGFSPNRQQRDAILNAAGLFFLTAGPGATKPVR